MKRLKRTMVQVFSMLFALTIALLGVESLLGTTPAALAGPNPITTCGTITSNSTLAADIVATATPCIVFGADNIALFMDGHQIDSRVPGNAAVAIQSVGKTNVRVEGPGTVLTTKTCPPCTFPFPGVGSINVSGGTNVRIRDVEVRNVDASGAPVLFAVRSGTGILLNGTPGALLLDNLVDSYARGVWVLNSSNAAGGGASLLGHNTITNNGSSPEFCFGLFLDGSSGWVLTHNTVNLNGFATFLGDENNIQLGKSPFAAPSATSSDNQVVGNTADASLGSGIAVITAGSVGNVFVKNHATLNNPVLADLRDANSAPSPNTWNDNNICNTEAGSVPPSVCNPGEM